MANSHEISPYGRSFDEYRLMFGLDDADRERHVLGVGDGPSNFNAEATRRGWRVVSVDPLYRCSAGEIAQRLPAVIDRKIEAVRLVPSHWTWSYSSDPEQLRELRTRTAADFLADYPRGVREGRYVAAWLPDLPFASGSFDLVLCSHLLFSWSTVLGVEFHLAAIAEMLRVGREVRIFPTSRNLATICWKHVDGIVDRLRADGFVVQRQWMPGSPRNASTEQLIVAHGGTEPRCLTRATA